MTTDHQKRDCQDKFQELLALAESDALTSDECVELKEHMQNCGSCREIHQEYRILVTCGLSQLADTSTYSEELEGWDDRGTRTKLFARVRAADNQRRLGRVRRFMLANFHRLQTIAATPQARAAFAVSLLLATGLVSYRIGMTQKSSATRARVVSQAGLRELAAEKTPINIDVERLRELTAEKSSVDALLTTQSNTLSGLRKEASQRDRELSILRSQWGILEERVRKISAENNATQEQLAAALQEREALKDQLQNAEKTQKTVQQEIAGVMEERDNALLRVASVESRLADLSAANREQARRLKDDEQYLAADRDVRELMGARGLYIADVFDVDSKSHTKKPFGRVFYTQGKSLIFYAFDLDGQPGVTNASAFQAWGRNETEQSRPENLGILYLDNQENRRWVLRCDDAMQLAEINAVFVTIEPRGGSERPTGKPFLYAALRKEVNHP